MADGSGLNNEEASLNIVKAHVGSNLSLGGEARLNIMDKIKLFEDCYRKIKHFEYIQNIFVIRAYVNITVPLRNPETQKIENSTHLCIFESTFGLFEPEALYLQRSPVDLFKYGKLGKWFLADVDGIMEGNPPISEFARDFKSKNFYDDFNGLEDPFRKNKMPSIEEIMNSYKLDKPNKDQNIKEYEKFDIKEMLKFNKDVL